MALDATTKESPAGWQSIRSEEGTDWLPCMRIMWLHLYLCWEVLSSTLMCTCRVSIDDMNRTQAGGPRPRAWTYLSTREWLHDTSQSYYTSMYVSKIIEFKKYTNQLRKGSTHRTEANYHGGICMYEFLLHARFKWRLGSLQSSYSNIYLQNCYNESRWIDDRDSSISGSYYGFCGPSVRRTNYKVKTVGAYALYISELCFLEEKTN